MCRVCSNKRMREWYSRRGKKGSRGGDTLRFKLAVHMLTHTADITATRLHTHTPTPVTSASTCPGLQGTWHHSSEQPVCSCSCCCGVVVVCIGRDVAVSWTAGGSRNSQRPHQATLQAGFSCHSTAKAFSNHPLAPPLSTNLT